MASRPRDIARECSPYLGQLMDRHPDWMERLEAGGRLQSDRAPQSGELEPLIEAAGLDPALRQFRNFEMMRIIWRELNGVASLAQTMHDLSRLAEICLDAALQTHAARLSGLHGTPCGESGEPQAMAVIGLGKLGGGELNLSSDIDIVFGFPETGTCDGPRALSNERFFTRLARATIASLSEVTEQGFCFRVDTRLRPFGAAGPLVCSFGAMEQYYQREGRDWERYALVKARPVAGDRAGGARLLEQLTPFVYRRYIDFGAIEALQEMHESVRADAARRGRQNDIKRGPGGIREIEFLVQGFQLLRGGREPRLQTPSLLEALDQLQALALLPPDSTDALRRDYHFLRRLENAIQALHDQQTHALPAGEDLERVARAMGIQPAIGLESELARVRGHVNAHFNQQFPRLEAPGHEQPWRAEWRLLKSGERPVDEAPPGGQALATFLHSLDRLSLSARAWERLDRFMPRLFEQLSRQELPDAALSDVFRLVAAVCRRSAYLSLLVQNPRALERMIGLFAASDWLAETVIRYPALLDELIDPALGKALPSREEMEATAQRILESDDDTEASLQALNHMKLAFGLRTAVAELEAALTASQAQHTLTDLAETIIGACWQLAAREVAARHGQLPGPGLAVIGYGSLGARELGYSSDLDLIFLYEAGEATSDGERPLSAERFQTRVARRMLSYLTATTASGRLYSVDTRLRPNGRAGPLVSSVTAFERYQHQDAWTWELQALTRGRALAGEKAIGGAFRRIRADVLRLPRDAARVRADVVEMRQRMRRELGDEEPLKHGAGGLVDIGFVAQLGILEGAHEHPELLEAVGTVAQLEALGQAAWLEAGAVSSLIAAHETLTRTRHRARLTRASQPAPDPGAEVRAICARQLPAEASS